MQSTLSSVQVQDRSRDEVPFGCGEGLPSMLGRGLGMFVSLPSAPEKNLYMLDGGRSPLSTLATSLTILSWQCVFVFL